MKPSVYAGYRDFSYEVSWEGKMPGQIEVLNQRLALEMCADLKRRCSATCHKIECRTGKRIKKLA